MQGQSYQVKNGSQFLSVKIFIAYKVMTAQIDCILTVKMTTEMAKKSPARLRELTTVLGETSSNLADVFWKTLCVIQVLSAVCSAFQ